MQRLEVSAAVGHIYMSLGFKSLMLNNVQFKMSADEGASLQHDQFCSCVFLVPSINEHQSQPNLQKPSKNAFGICVFIICSPSSLSRITATVFGVDENIPLSDTDLIDVHMTVRNNDNEMIYQCQTISCYRIISNITRITL